MAEENKPEKEKTCFVICPIGEEGSEQRKISDMVFDYILQPVLNKFGYFSFRSDHINDPGMITSQIIDGILESDLVIADLSEQNPNVFYEFAVRHAVRKPVIPISRDQKLPFDVSEIRTIMYSLDIKGGEIAKGELEKRIIAIESGSCKYESPISQVIDLKSSSVNSTEKDLLLKIYDILKSSKSGYSNYREDYMHSFAYEHLNKIQEKILEQIEKNQSTLLDLTLQQNELSERVNKPTSKKQVPNINFELEILETRLIEVVIFNEFLKELLPYASSKRMLQRTLDGFSVSFKIE